MTTTQPGRVARWRNRRAERAARLTNAGRLTPASRGILGISGTAMVGTGATAVFVTEVEAGPTALITVGGLLLVVATMGRRISSIGLTEGTLAFEEQVRTDLSQARDDTERVQIASEAVAEQPRIETVPDIAATSERAYNNLVEERLVGHFGDQVKVTPPMDGGRVRPDFLVTAGGKTVLVETGFGDPNRVMDQHKLFLRVKPSYLLAEEVDAIVVVSNMMEPALSYLGEARELAQRSNKTFAYARWTGDGDTAGLIRTIEAHLQS